jgi:hypothetical protein
VASKSDAEMSVAEFLKDLQNSTEDKRTKHERLITYALVHWPSRWRVAPPDRALPDASHMSQLAGSEGQTSGD